MTISQKITPLFGSIVLMAPRMAVYWEMRWNGGLGQPRMGIILDKFVAWMCYWPMVMLFTLEGDETSKLFIPIDGG